MPVPARSGVEAARSHQPTLVVKLFSKDETFFDHFRQLAVDIGRAAVLLKELMNSPRDAARIAAEIKKIEHEGDAVVHLVNQRIDTSFVTPLDREDIHLLATRLDNVIDLINGAARRTVMFRITETRAGAPEMAELLVRAGQVIHDSVSQMTKRAAIMEHGRNMKAIEVEGDMRYAECVGALFTNEVSPIEVIKWKEIFDALEHALDECEDVSNVLESIALKNS